MNDLIDKAEKHFNSFIIRDSKKVCNKTLSEINEKHISEGIDQVFQNTSSISTWISDENNIALTITQHDSLWDGKSGTEETFKYYSGYWSEEINFFTPISIRKSFIRFHKINGQLSSEKAHAISGKDSLNHTLRKMLCLFS